MDGKELGNTYSHAMPDSTRHDYEQGGGVHGSVGITLRQHFAGLALQGILANRVYDPPRRDRLAMMAIDAVSAADCLLVELSKGANDGR